jgi:hypothetical protein
MTGCGGTVYRINNGWLTAPSGGRGEDELNWEGRP